MQPYFERDGITLYHGDCRDVLPTLDPGSVDAVITDPPYGIGYEHSGKGAAPGGRGIGRRNVGPIYGDDRPFDPSPLLPFGNVLMWGANHYADRLPRGGRWLAWDKLSGMAVADSFGDVDFAWHSRPGAARLVSFAWKGIARRHAESDGEQRWHPSQKPVEVMKWSIEQAKVPLDGLVLDPYAGSGTTGVACLKMGLRCILIEKDARYLDVIERRIRAAETPLFAGLAAEATA
jgi:site-specific DNA-methyltransferase (adenine-specific)